MSKMRELKSRKKKFGFEMSIFTTECITAAAKVIEVVNWMDKDALIDFSRDYGKSEFKVYTDNELLAEELRLNHCIKFS